MGIYNFPDILQKNINDLFHGFELYLFVHIRHFDINKRRPEKSCTEVGINAK